MLPRELSASGDGSRIAVRLFGTLGTTCAVERDEVHVANVGDPGLGAPLPLTVGDPLYGFVVLSRSGGRLFFVKDGGVQSTNADGTGLRKESGVSPFPEAGEAGAYVTTQVVGVANDAFVIFALGSGATSQLVAAPMVATELAPRLVGPPSMYSSTAFTWTP